MCGELFGIICLIILVCSFHGTEQLKVNSLAEKHLRIIAPEFPINVLVKRNTTDHVVEIDGVLKHHIVALSDMFNFSYTYLSVERSVLDDSIGKKGAISYLVNNEADYVLTNAIATTSRYKNVDFPSTWFEGPFGCIVPYPKETVNIAASVKPFSYEVWVTVVIAVFVIIFFLRLMNKHHVKKEKSNPYNQTGGTGRVAVLVLGNLVSQGQLCYSTNLAFRIAVGAWCAGCFFLVQIYCSTLTSHLTWPNQKPIANSIEELTNAGASLAIDRGFALDVILQSVETEKFRQLTKLLKENPTLRCNSTDKCLEIVRNGFAGYSASTIGLLLTMEQDLKSSGICRYYMMKDSFFHSYVYTLLRKNSPYTESISQGILRIRQAGLYEHWKSLYLSKPLKCMELNRRGNTTRRLSIGHLSSAFCILFAGYVCSILARGFEKITNLSKFK